MNTTDIRAAVEKAAKEYGATDFEVKINSEVSASAEALKDEINAVGYTRSGSVSVRCVKDGKSGFASGDVSDIDRLETLVRMAVANAEAIDDADEVPLFEGSFEYQTVQPRRDEMPSTDCLKEKALRMQRMTYAASDKIVDGTQVTAACQSTSSVFISSAGLNLSYDESANYSFVYAAVKDGDDATSGTSFRLDGEKTEQEMVDEAVNEALDTLGGKAIASGRYDIILDSPTMANLLSAFWSVFSAKSAFLKTTRLAGKEETVVASDVLSVIDDPFHPKKLGKCPFDGEGVAVYRKSIIDRGVLKTLLYNRLYAKKMGKTTTGNARSATEISPRGLYVEGGEKTKEQLLQTLGNGLYITELKGLHAGVNPQSGDFSLEAAGFVVEDGQKVRAVKNITVADNFFDLIKKVYAVADNVGFRVGSNFGAPDVMFKDIAVSGE